MNGETEAPPLKRSDLLFGVAISLASIQTVISSGKYFVRINIESFSDYLFEIADFIASFINYYILLLLVGFVCRWLIVVIVDDKAKYFANKISTA